MPDDLAPIIAGLNEAQKNALIRPLMSGELYVRTHSRTVSALFRRGLVRSGAPRLTPLGEEVATVLYARWRENKGRW